MTNPEIDPELPEFVREALADAPEASPSPGARGLPALQELFPPLDARAGAQPLIAAVSELPLRYAPFYSRIASLWDTSEEDVVAVLERAKQPSSWRKPGLFGLRVIDVKGGPKTRGADVHLVHFAPGMRFPRHRHPGPEALLVLEGDYTDSMGRTVGPGDVQTMDPGSEHSFKVGSGGPCVAASVQAGREFTGPWMRLFAKLRG